MSAEATGWVWRYSPCTGTQLLVHLAIADVVNDAHEHEFWMSTAALACKARVSRSTATSTLADLLAAGMLEVVKSGGASRRPTVYRFVFWRPPEAGGDRSGAPDPLARSGGPLARSPDQLDQPPDMTSPVSAREPKGTQENEMRPKGASPVSALEPAVPPPWIAAGITHAEWARA